MRKFSFLFLLLTSPFAFGQDCHMAPRNCALVSEKYPSVFVFESVQSYSNNNNVTVGQGVLITQDESRTQKDGSHERREKIGKVVCEAYFEPMHTFAARLKKPHQLGVQRRKLGSDSTHEVSCKF